MPYLSADSYPKEYFNTLRSAAKGETRIDCKAYNKAVNLRTEFYKLRKHLRTSHKLDHKRYYSIIKQLKFYIVGTELRLVKKQTTF